MARITTIKDERFNFGNGDWVRRHEAALAEYQARSDALPDGEIVGFLAQFQIADGYAYYVVTNAKPLTLAHVPFLDGYQISAAEGRGLRVSDILAQKRRAAFWQDMRNEHEQFYANLPVGSIVHYDNGFAQFVRCVRVEGSDNRLQALALVGNWNKYDLTDSYWTKMIRTAERLEPNYSNIWRRRMLRHVRGRCARRTHRPPSRL